MEEPIIVESRQAGPWGLVLGGFKDPHTPTPVVVGELKNNQETIDTIIEYRAHLLTPL